MDITIRPTVKTDFDELTKFCIKALVEEHKTLVSKEEIQELLSKYKNDSWIDDWCKDPDWKVFVAVDEKSAIIGFLRVRYFDSKDSILFILTTLPGEARNTIRDKFLEKLLEEFPFIKDMFVDVYERNAEEVDFFIRRGFKVWDTSTRPIGKPILNVHLMQKVLNKKSDYVNI